MGFTMFLCSTVKWIASQGFNLSKVTFILDNFPVHRSKHVQDSFSSSIDLLFTPPYCPFLNCIELFWGQLKKGMSGFKCDSDAEVFAAMVSKIRGFKPSVFAKNFHFCTLFPPWRRTQKYLIKSDSGYFCIKKVGFFLSKDLYSGVLECSGFLDCSGI